MKLSIYDPQNDYRLVDYIVTRSISLGQLPYNFYSLIQYGIMLNELMPIDLLRDLHYNDESFDFDRAYANKLLSHEPTFIQLMTLLHDIELRDETILLSNYTNEQMMPIIDSLLKFIYERYGIDSFIINTIEDIDHFTSSEFASQYHYQTFVSDVQRYYKLTKKPTYIASREEIEEDLKSLYDNSELIGYGAI